MRNSSSKQIITIRLYFPLFLGSKTDTMATNQTLGSKIIDSYEIAVENHLSTEEPRYVPFKDRRLSGDMSLKAMLNSSHGTC